MLNNGIVSGCELLKIRLIYIRESWINLMTMRGRSESYEMRSRSSPLKKLFYRRGTVDIKNTSACKKHEWGITYVFYVIE